MTKIRMEKTLEGLIPADAEGAIALGKIALGDVVQVDVVQPRQSNFHRKFFSLLRLVLDNQEKYQSEDELLDALKIGVGHCDTIERNGVKYRIPKSISYDALSNEEFAAFYDRAVHWVCTSVIPGMDERGLDEEVRNKLLSFGD